ncbi:hypothetical protein FAZ15_06110 [Sphingobacterium olei]|uniref:Uncharacterized protein n=1 Tax=Sphingobacterium olei TaxID=2571155 RepID=A0A4U0P446_9SPHI|nr:hypothetical protein [Sphingobacterium olei]TJZ62083.1 hypothetical protein FAZ15_06110 [Sphingobacterium olei]
MSTKINNIVELKLEIARLKKLKSEQELYLDTQYTLMRTKLETPYRVIRTITSQIPGYGLVKGLISSASNMDSDNNMKKGSSSDWLTRTLQLGLPFVLNKTFLKKSGWLKKSLVLLASETAAGQINQNSVTGVISKITEFVKPNKKRKKHKDVPPLEEEPDVINFGVAPGGETY